MLNHLAVPVLGLYGSADSVDRRRDDRCRPGPEPERDNGSSTTVPATTSSTTAAPTTMPPPPPMPTAGSRNSFRRPFPSRKRWTRGRELSRACRTDLASEPRSRRMTDLRRRSSGLSPSGRSRRSATRRFRRRRRPLPSPLGSQVTLRPTVADRSRYSAPTPIPGPADSRSREAVSPGPSRYRPRLPGPGRRSIAPRLPSGGSGHQRLRPHPTMRTPPEPSTRIPPTLFSPTTADHWAISGRPRPRGRRRPPGRPPGGSTATTRCPKSGG